MKDRIEKTEKQINQYFDKSKSIMIQKNRDRGDCWRNSGLLAQFIEIHSMYFRLRNLLWIGEIPKDLPPEWRDQVQNALEDLRNFTILAEMCLNEGNIKGEEYCNGLQNLTTR